MATSWDEPDCPRCRRDFHRIQTGPERGLGVYSECPPCEAARRARSAAAAESARRRAIVSESAEHWRKLRRSERGKELAEELEAVEGDDGPLPNPPAEVTISFVVPKAFLLGIAKALAELGSRDDEVSSLIRNGASCRPDGLFLTLPDDMSVLQAVRRSARQLAGDATADTTIRVRAMDVVNALDKAMEE